MSAASKRRHATLYRRLLENMLLICLVPLFLVGGAAYLQFKHYAARMVLDQQERLVLNHRDFIESYLRGRIAELTAIANQYTLEQLRAGELERVFAVIQQGAGIFQSAAGAHETGVIHSQDDGAPVGGEEMSKSKFFHGSLTLYR